MRPIRRAAERSMWCRPRQCSRAAGRPA